MTPKMEPKPQTHGSFKDKVGTLLKMFRDGVGQAGAEDDILVSWQGPCVANYLYDFLTFYVWVISLGHCIFYLSVPSSFSFFSKYSIISCPCSYHSPFTNCPSYLALPQNKPARKKTPPSPAPKKASAGLDMADYLTLGANLMKVGPLVS